MRHTVWTVAAFFCAALVTPTALAADKLEVVVEVTQVKTHPYFAIKFRSADGEVRGTATLKFQPDGEIPTRLEAGSRGRMRASAGVLEARQGPVRVRFGGDKWRRGELVHDADGPPRAGEKR